MSASLLRAVARVLAIVPLRWIHAIAVPLGRLLGWLPWRKHAVVRRNLDACFPTLGRDDRRRLEQAQRVELLRVPGELGALAHWSAERLDAHVEIAQGWTELEQALAEGRGVLLVSGHLGNWEILNLLLSRYLSMVTLYLAPKNPAMDRFITEARERFGGIMVPSGSAAMRELLRQLKRGGRLALPPTFSPSRAMGCSFLFSTTRP